jgi:hypothetical protein
MSILYTLAKELANNEHLNGQWPSLTDEDGDVVEPTRCTQTGNWTLSFNEAVFPYEPYRRPGTVEYMEELEDVEGLPFVGEYDEGETITKAEYEEFLQTVVGGDASKLSAYFEAKVRENTAKIAELNEQVGVLVDQIANLAYEAGLPVSVDLGNRGSLSLDGPWDSSSAYC